MKRQIRWFLSDIPILITIVVIALAIVGVFQVIVDLVKLGISSNG